MGGIRSKITKLRALPRVYTIADLDAIGGRDLPSVVAEMARAGVRWIQVRAKGASGADAYRWAVEAIARLDEKTEAAIWIDDRVDVAALVAAAGVQLGQADLPPRAARRVVGGEVAIGRSTHDLEQVRAADADREVDLMAFGPIFSTTGKLRPDPPVGLDGLREARRWTTKPLVAIGGIDARNLPAVLAAGADCVAVLGAACRGDVLTSCRRLLAAAGGER